jgi:hypothetical protein
MIRIREMRNAYEVMGGNRKGRDHFGDLDIVERMMLTCFLKKYDGRVFTGIAWAGVGFSSGNL